MPSSEHFFGLGQSTAQYNKLMTGIQSNLTALDFLSNNKISVGGSDSKFAFTLVVPGAASGQVSGVPAVPFYHGIADGLNKLNLSPSGAAKIVTGFSGTPFNLLQTKTATLAADSSPTAGTATDLLTLSSFITSGNLSTIYISANITIKQTQSASSSGGLNLPFSITDSFGNTLATATLFPSASNNGFNDVISGNLAILYPNLNRLNYSINLHCAPSAAIALTYKSGTKTGSGLSMIEFA